MATTVDPLIVDVSHRRRLLLCLSSVDVTSVGRRFKASIEKSLFGDRAGVSASMVSK